MKFGGWLRIGVVLWLIGFPIYSHIDEDKSNWKHYNTCIDIHTKYFPNPDPKADILGTCRKSAFDLTRPILLNDRFWIFFVAVPLALFWILGGVIFWTIRWIRRGFVGSGKL